MRPMPELTVYEIPIDDLIPYANNAKKHPQKQVDNIVASMDAFGMCDPIAVWHNEDGDPEIVEGHGRVLALKKLGIKTAPVIYLDHLTDEQRRIYTHVHNQTTLNSGFDEDTLIEDMDNLNADWESFGFDEYLYNADAVIDEPTPEEIRQTLRERFGFVPFSVIRTTTAEWTDRKKKWLSLGIRSELGRGGGTCFQLQDVSRGIAPIAGKGDDGTPIR